MKVFKVAIASVLMSAAAPMVLAASTVDLSVTGSLVPTSCTPSLAAGEISFGKLSAKDLRLDKSTEIGGFKFEQMTIQCQGPTLFGIRGVDNRANTRPVHSGVPTFAAPFGLGLTANNEKIGTYHLELHPDRSMIDGAKGYLTLSNLTGTAWGASSAGERNIRNNGPLLGYTDTLGVSTGPIPVKEAILGIRSYMVVAPANTLTLDQDIALDGSATLEVVYL
ncbi:MAG: DUF1120 domain-containing protein [Pseudomonas sp.]|nr:DUF1120 domain-containing protein [Pseudomonas sp.]